MLGPALFRMPLETRFGKRRAQFKPKGVEAVAYMGDVSLATLEFSEEAVQTVTFQNRRLAGV